MNNEHRRQFIHLSGFIFVILSQTLGGLIIAIYSFMIACFFAFYSYYIKQEKKKINKILEKMDQLENRFRNFVFSVSRDEEKTEKFFHGPFWFFLSMGITFLFFPLWIATIAAATLAVGDVFSNIIGSRIGKHKIYRGRSLEGSSAFFVSSLTACLLFVNPFYAVICAFVGTVTELFSVHNDNLTIPLSCAFAMLFVSIIL